MKAREIFTNYNLVCFNLILRRLIKIILIYKIIYFLRESSINDISSHYQPYKLAEKTQLK